MFWAKLISFLLQLCGGTFPYGVNVIDEVEVPHVPSGEYVLGLRADMEMTAQIWQQCADIVIERSA
jgi:hypothetical protein